MNISLLLQEEDIPIADSSLGQRQVDIMPENSCQSLPTQVPLHEAFQVAVRKTQENQSKITSGVNEQQTMQSSDSDCIYQMKGGKLSNLDASFCDQTEQSTYFTEESPDDDDDDRTCISELTRSVSQRISFGQWQDSCHSLNTFSSRQSHDTNADTIISQRLLDYGIVNLEKKKVRIDKVPLRIKKAVDEVHRWLFVEGGHFESVEDLMTNYSLLVRELGIPVDRLYYGGIGLHPRLTAYLWKWEPDDFIFREMPEEVFVRRNELFSPDEPFCQLEQGKADFIRIRASDEYIPPDTEKWFRGDNYQDYYALPDIHRNQSKGGLAWATKDFDGFSDDHIQFFKLTLPALTTVMRVHTNDLVLRTLTERMEMEIEERTQELAQANLNLGKANERLEVQAKKQLEHFACMSHEIRTPLNCILGLSSLILETHEELNPDLIDSIRMINTSSELLHAVVNDVLDYSKMESGVFEVDIRESNLEDTLNGVVHAMKEKVQQKDVTIRANYGATLPEYIQTDSRRLQQVLYNLIGNAGKFSKVGAVVDFTVSLVSSDTNPKMMSTATSSGQILRFSIKDYGKGIDEKDFEGIFRPFNQAGKETATMYGGTGLGLSITKKLVDRLGGTISVDSKLGEFAEFIVDLPFHGAPTNVVDLSARLEKAAIILLGDNTLESHPFNSDVIKAYKIDFMKASSWSDVHQILVDAPQRFWKDQHYVVLCKTDLYNRDAFKKFSKYVGRCSLLTFGGHGATPIPNESRHHFVSLNNTFPTVAIQTIDRLITATKEDKEKPITKLPPKPLFANTPSSIPPVIEIQVPTPTTDRKSYSDNNSLDGVANLFGGQTSSNTETTSRESSDDAIDSHNREKGALMAPTETAIDNPSTIHTSTVSLVASTKPKELKDLKVLYAEDNKINQKVLNRMLTKLGIQNIDIVEDGKQAVNKTAQQQGYYDIIFMDMQMPVMDGLEATRLIKQRDGDKSYVVFCTAHAVENFRSEAEEAGGDGFISKPFNVKRIKDFLEDFVANR